MWFNDIDIELRHPSWQRRVEGVAPGRHRVALDRYLERRTRQEMERRCYEFEAKFGTMRAWVAALIAHLGRNVVRSEPADPA